MNIIRTDSVMAIVITPPIDCEVSDGMGFTYHQKYISLTILFYILVFYNLITLLLEYADTYIYTPQGWDANMTRDILCLYLYLYI